MRLNTPDRSKAGFTLAEILLAMMVFAIAITTILGLLARAITTADSILVKDQAIGLSSALDSHLTEMDFADAYDLVVNGNAYLYAYQYRAQTDPSTLRTDGTMNPYPVLLDTDQLGIDYVVVSGVRPEADPLLNADAEAREGRLFQVHLSVSEANPFGNTGLPVDPDVMSGSTGFPTYDSAVLVIFAEFYEVNGTGGGKLDPTDVTPVFSFNFAVRR